MADSCNGYNNPATQVIKGGRHCTICAHANRDKIDRALITGEPYRSVAKRFGASGPAVYRHQQDHLPASLLKAQEVAEVARADDLLGQVKAIINRVQKLFDACDTWLTDPDDPSRYVIGPRAEDVQVIYTEEGPDGKRNRCKERLSALLARAGEGRRSFELVEVKHADPRELVLKAAKTLQGHMELLAELMGKLDQRPQVNIHHHPEWIELRTVILLALEPYPEARLALAARLKERGDGARR